MILCFDTETTGKVNFKAECEDDSQPNLVQLGCVLSDDDGKIAAQVEFVVKPEGWVIPYEATAIHGISNEFATEYGVPLKTVLSCFNMMSKRADFIVAHSLDFDERVMDTAFYREGLTWLHAMPNWCCTMKMATPILELPGNYGKFKWPSLAEAHKSLCGADVVDAHSALADALACHRIYVAMKAEAVRELSVAGVQRRRG